MDVLLDDMMLLQPRCERSVEIRARITHTDIFSHIIPFCDQATLTLLSRVNKHIEHLVTPVLYRHVVTTVQSHKASPIPRPTIDVPAIHIGWPYPDPSLSLRSEGPSPAAQKSANDEIRLSERMRSALKYTTVLDIHGHHVECEALGYTDGYPTEVIRCLANVHTVRIIPFRTHMTLAAGAKEALFFCPSCTLYGSTTCSLTRALRPRYIILPTPTPDGLGEALIGGFREIFVGTVQTYIYIMHHHLSNEREFEWLQHFPTGPSVLVIIRQVNLTESDIKLILDALCNQLLRSPSTSARIACHPNLVRQFEARLTAVRIAPLRDSSWVEKLRVDSAALVTVVDIGSVMKESWVEAFGGDDIEHW